MPLNIAAVREAFPSRTIYWHRTLPSTMPEAARLAAEGAAAGTVVGADEQTSGQGRYNRHWHSEADAGLYQSIILRLPIHPAKLPVITLALGLAGAQAVQRVSSVACDIRWPNDILLGERKCAGILVQLHGDAVVAGIGINVNQTAFPPEVEQTATSLRAVSGRLHSREQLLIALLEEIDTHCAILVDQGVTPILTMFEQASSYARGRRVVVDDTLTGTTDGLTADGFLRLRQDSGREEVIFAGGVRPCS